MNGALLKSSQNRLCSSEDTHIFIGTRNNRPWGMDRIRCFNDPLACLSDVIKVFKNFLIVLIYLPSSRGVRQQQFDACALRLTRQMKPKLNDLHIIGNKCVLKLSDCADHCLELIWIDLLIRKLLQNRHIYRTKHNPYGSFWWNTVPNSSNRRIGFFFLSGFVKSECSHMPWIQPFIEKINGFTFTRTVDTGHYNH